MYRRRKMPVRLQSNAKETTQTFKLKHVKYLSQVDINMIETMICGIKAYQEKKSEIKSKPIQENGSTGSTGSEITVGEEKESKVEFIKCETKSIALISNEDSLSKNPESPESRARSLSILKSEIDIDDILEDMKSFNFSSDDELHFQKRSEGSKLNVELTIHEEEYEDDEGW